MPRKNRNLEFKMVRINQKDYDFLIRNKRHSKEQIDSVLSRLLNTELAEAEFMYQEQIKITQSWMQKYRLLLQDRTTHLESFIYDKLQ